MVSNPRFSPPDDGLVDIAVANRYPARRGKARRGQQNPHRHLGRPLPFAGSYAGQRQSCHHPPTFNRCPALESVRVPYLRGGVGKWLASEHGVTMQTEVLIGVWPSSPLQVGGSPAREDL